MIVSKDTPLTCFRNNRDNMIKHEKLEILFNHQHFLRFVQINDSQIQNSHVENKSLQKAFPPKLSIFLYQSRCGNNV